MPQHVTRITRKGQVTIPAAIRRLLGVGPHDTVAFLVEAGQVRIAPAQSVVAQTAGMLKSDQPMRSPQEEQAAVEEAMAQEVEEG
ncbi:MAG: AbrB/MazE/SpoVT family DNA-binding domain-containing protein [Chloroflexi bacterium]|nr:AbrB/MazE/SpoVT family DNA-binding domain-containing protein [Chloroflexota bacterium]